MNMMILKWRGSVGDLATDICDAIGRENVKELRVELERMLNHEPQKFPTEEVEFGKTTRYNSDESGVEAIDVIENLPFNVGTALKYIWRREHKGGAQDLRKAAFYLRRESERLAESRTVEESMKQTSIVLECSKDELLKYALLVAETSMSEPVRLLDIANKLAALADVQESPEAAG